MHSDILASLEQGVVVRRRMVTWSPQPRGTWTWPSMINMVETPSRRVIIWKALCALSTQAELSRRLLQASLDAHLIGGTPEAIEPTQRTVFGQSVPRVE